MALDKLLEHEAHSEIERIGAVAQGQAEQLIAQARERAQTMIDSRRRALDSEYAAGLTRARSAADLDGNAQRLEATNSLQVQAFERAEQHLRSAPQAPEYPQVLARLIAQGLESLPGATVVEAAPAEHDAVRQALGQLGRSMDVRANPRVTTGVRLVSTDGKTSIQNTLLGRLERVRGDLAPQISRLVAE
ncbi:V-type ATP synthase subunit E [Deinococcus yunweiensis]|uniref:V-type ATP synthase subunit E n=1 Tax=Deinococcus yunweiensis TaxID=367282 RepID=UPI00398EF06C